MMAGGPSPVKAEAVADQRASFTSAEKPNFGSTNDMSAKLEQILK